MNKHSFLKMSTLVLSLSSSMGAEQTHREGNTGECTIKDSATSQSFPDTINSQLVSAKESLKRKHPLIYKSLYWSTCGAVAGFVGNHYLTFVKGAGNVPKLYGAAFTLSFIAWCFKDCCRTYPAFSYRPALFSQKYVEENNYFLLFGISGSFVAGSLLPYATIEAIEAGLNMIDSVVHNPESLYSRFRHKYWEKPYRTASLAGATAAFLGLTVYQVYKHLYHSYRYSCHNKI